MGRLLEGIDAITAETDARIAKQLSRGKEGLDTKPPLAGPVGGDLTPGTSAAGPWDLALWASALGEADEADDLLAEAIEHQQEHVAMLRRNLASRSGLHRIHVREAELAAGEHLLEVMRACVGDAGVLAARARHERVREMHFGEELRVFALVEDELCKALPAGPEGFRQLAVAAWHAMGEGGRADEADSASDQGIERSMRIARAISLMDDKQRQDRALGNGGRFGLRTIPSLLRTVGDRYLSDDDIDVMRVRQLDQDHWDATVFGPRGVLRATDNSKSESAREAIAAARRMLRLSPHVARRHRWSDEDGVGVRTYVSAEAMAEIHARLKDRPGARDLRIVTTRSPGHTVTRGFAIQFHLDAEIDGRPICLEFHAPIKGQSRSRRPEAIARAARAEADAAGFVVPEGPVDAAVVTSDLRRFSETSPDPEAPRGRYGSLDRLLGHERCRHETAKWSRDYQAGVVCLDCSECRRDRLVVVPLHRLPKGHVQALRPDVNPENADRYLQEVRVFRALQGETDPPQTLEELQRRDPPLSTDITDYWIGYDAEPASSQRSTSIEEVLGARRRGAVARP